MDTAPASIRALLDKYLEMRGMRLENDAGVPHNPRARMATLAARFPGALRQLDRLTLAELDSRIAVLEHCARAPDETMALPAWAHWECAYHGCLRVLLAIKRAVGNAGDPAELRKSFIAGFVAALDEPSASEVGAELYELAVAPPGGRLHRVAAAWVAERFSVNVENVERALAGGLPNP